MKRSQPEIETAIYFLCALVKDLDIHDWGKLRGVLQFLSQTIWGYRVIGADNIYEVLTYVEASYAMHNNMRGHNGGCMTFGWGLIHEKLYKQKLNTKGSTESEVVRASGFVQFSIWLAIYMEHQDYNVKRKQLVQDNIISMKMEKNGQYLCAVNYRHINI